MYWAVVDNPPVQIEGKLINYLWRSETKNKSYVVHEDRSNAVYAELDYKLLAESDRYFLVEVILHTGRHHQIRAQLAHLGCKIKGDLKYGAPRSNPDASIHLHARFLEFYHPVSKKNIRIVAPLPNEPLWNYFGKTIPKNYFP